MNPIIFITFLIGSISFGVCDAKPFEDGTSYNEEEDYENDFSELSRRAAGPNDALFPKFPGDYEYTEEENPTTDNVIPAFDETTAVVVVEDKPDVPWYKTAGRWLKKNYKTVKEKVPDYKAEAERWLKEQFKKLKEVTADERY